MVNSGRIPVSIEELALLRLIEEVQYGELVDVDIPEAPRNASANLKPETAILISLIRDGNPHLECVKVHQGKPTQVIIAGKTGKLKYKKKIQI